MKLSPALLLLFIALFFISCKKSTPSQQSNQPTGSSGPFNGQTQYWKVTETSSVQGSVDVLGYPNDTTLVFVGKTIPGADSLITFVQSGRIPSTYWMDDYPFHQVEGKDTLTPPNNITTMSGVIANDSTININYSVTLSISLSYIPQAVIKQTWQKITHLADTALYTYKDTATNQIITVAGCSLYKSITGACPQNPVVNNGPATQAVLDTPQFITLDHHGTIYIVESGDNEIRKIDQNGIITLVAGVGTAGYSGDGQLATEAQLNTPKMITFDQADNLYIADDGNYVIRKIDHATGIITTIAGNGTSGYTGDGGPALQAQMKSVYGLVFDAKGDLIFVDGYANVVRKITPAGIISTIAGTGAQGLFGDGGPAIHAVFAAPFDITIDRAQNIYVCELGNQLVRKIDTFGIITTFAGNGTIAWTGDNGPATQAGIYLPFGLAADSVGDIYIIDGHIRKVTPNGIITTVATGGNGYYYSFGPWTYSGDHSNVLSAAFVISDMAVDGSGNLFIVDGGNGRIREIFAH